MANGYGIDPFMRQLGAQGNLRGMQEDEWSAYLSLIHI